LLRQLFNTTISIYTADKNLQNDLWLEIKEKYTDRKRHYHNLMHLENLVNELLPVKQIIKDWDVIVFSVFYHDIIYSAISGDNEEKSAALARFRLGEISFPEEKIERCVQQILATKGHELALDNDTNLFTDADLSILGKPWATYQGYFIAVRKEYSFYPDLLYKPGRKKVLKHFLNMDRIFKTGHFNHLYEMQARENLVRELAGN
jgi:predicted metal-dependent HD superfamily phosphohydrolase